MNKIPERHLVLEGAHNIRDLGGYPTTDGNMTAWRRFLRADSPHRLSALGIESLREQGLSAVIDLRSPQEVNDQPNPFSDMHDVDFVNIPVFDDLSPVLSSQRETTAFEDPLLDFYVRALTERQKAIRDVLTAMSEARQGAVMFHCTAGKDRTGLIAALLLSIANVGRAQILEDYRLTGPLIVNIVEEFLELARQRGTDLVSYRRMLACEAATMEAALAHVENRHNSLGGYLTDIGMNREAVGRLRGRLLMTPRGPS